jgi:hypothetical protein
MASLFATATLAPPRFDCSATPPAPGVVEVGAGGFAERARTLGIIDPRSARGLRPRWSRTPAASQRVVTPPPR